MKDIFTTDRLLSCWQSLLFIIFILMQNFFVMPAQVRKDLPVAIKPETIRLYSMGEAVLLARVLGYWLQSYDSQSGRVVSYGEWNYDNLIAWLKVILRLDPQTQEPLLAASRIFIEVKDAERIHKMILFIREEYRLNPDKRWRWMVDATLHAKHRLQDQQLALQMARELRHLSIDADIPYWVRDIEHLILAQLGETESASLIITSMLESGTIRDASELQFLAQQLEALKENVNK